MTDVELLEQHRAGNDTAFTELVRRHLGWVYGMARRRLRDSHLAEDVAQAVFVLLHQKSPHFPADGAMINWLHKTTWYATEAVAKTEKRRRKRESEAATMQPTTTDSSPSEWDQLAPLLDQLIERLSASDREAVLLRYFREMSFAQVAAQIGTTEDAARKRVERAVTKLRDFASNKGVEISASALALNLTNHVITSPPAGLIAAATGSATAPASSALVSTLNPIIKGVVVMMTSAKLTVIGFAAAVALVVSGGVWTAMQFSPRAAPPPPPPSSPQVVQVPEQPPIVPRAAQSRPDWSVNNSFPKLSPFAGIRWRDTTPEVLVNGTWYEWLGLDDLTTDQIVSAAQQYDRKDWQKRINEDLVQLLSLMGHPPGQSVTLKLRNLQTNEIGNLQDVAMSEANRQAIWEQTNKPVAGNPDWALNNSFPKLAPFSGIRWRDNTPEVLVNGVWYEWLGLNDQNISQIVGAAQQLDPRNWQKRINEDLVELLSRTGHQPGPTVTLKLRNLQSNEVVNLENVGMTEANRQAIMEQTHQPVMPIR